MDLIAIELLLWAGLIFFFWALKDALNHVESDIEALGFNAGRRASNLSTGFQYDRPDQLIEAIGNYMDIQIFRYAVIAGENYQFDHIFSSGSQMGPEDEQRCLAPGLVYVRCQDHQKECA